MDKTGGYAFGIVFKEWRRGSERTVSPSRVSLGEYIESDFWGEMIDEGRGQESDRSEAFRNCQMPDL